MESNIAPNCMVVTPHHLATQSAVAILREGGTAVEAMVSAAATIAVVYPHMNSIGGDSFWLIVPPNGDPIVIEACGAAGSLATPEFFKDYKTIPYKGPKAANTVAGTIGGWEEALKYISECGYQKMSLKKLLADAIMYAENGFPVTKSQYTSLKNIQASGNVPTEFEKVFIPNGKIPKVGEKFCQKRLAKTLQQLAKNGLKSFYKGELATLIAEDMTSLGMPITESDLANYAPVRKVPLRLLHSHGEIFNVPPPTQGLVSLAILGILDKLGVDGQHEGQFIHATVEATKKAFQMRDQHITDQAYMKTDPNSLLTSQNLFEMAKGINFDQAHGAVSCKAAGDTIWMGAMDNKGFSVSFIQSIYHQFGSNVVLPQTGIVWHNRGIAFNLERDHMLCIKPGKKPFHTLNPAAARLRDGRVLVYGTRGGDGQPQTQAAIFHRYVVQGLDLQSSVSDPRWIYGRISGDPQTTLKLENRFSAETVSYLKEKGHDIVMLPDYSEDTGQAGALVRHLDGNVEGAFDPRSNGSAAGF
ncbi:oxamate amidohydrolase proenzyme-like [Helicoverpa zea]|uniref:oxamate amidohydrolase proenzyme-like n=1 Tax=Helicoverpa zea TaxID=7113 RepID=UPI001F59E359|nr:oxamate amidohydrolase proenzyme-like [Helicoverpa zea]XP_047022329.1 oxamate amidohydrolase proenzyme-like [Helicoverpa zea]